MTQKRTGRVALPYLAAWRTKQFKTQRMLASSSGVSASSINALERGYTQANFATVGKLARGLGISMDQLVHVNPEAGEQKNRDEGETSGELETGAA